MFVVWFISSRSRPPANHRSSLKVRCQSSTTRSSAITKQRRLHVLLSLLLCPDSLVQPPNLTRNSPDPLFCKRYIPEVFKSTDVIPIHSTPSSIHPILHFPGVFLLPFFSSLSLNFLYLSLSLYLSRSLCVYVSFYLCLCLPQSLSFCDLSGQESCIVC